MCHFLAYLSLLHWPNCWLLFLWFMGVKSPTNCGGKNCHKFSNPSSLIFFILFKNSIIITKENNTPQPNSLLLHLDQTVWWWGKICGVPSLPASSPLLPRQQTHWDSKALLTVLSPPPIYMLPTLNMVAMFSPM